MADRREAPARSPGAADGLMPAASAADRERVLLLECRLEEMRAALDGARQEADRARSKLAEASAREADHARRYSLIHEELAEARAEIAVLHRHLERSEALRAEVAGHLFEGGTREDVEELVRLRQKVLAEDQRALMSDRTVARLRERVEELVASRETLLTRIAEWQQLIREDGPEAADLSEFLAELRREILDLEHRNVISNAREAALRERLALAGIDPEAAEPAEAGEVHEDRAEAPEASERLEETAEARPENEVTEEAQEPVTRPDPDAAEQLDVSEVVEARPVRPEPEATEELERPQEVEEGAGPSDDPPSDEETAPETLVSPAGLGQTDALVAELGDAEVPTLQADLLLRLGRSGDPGVVRAVRPWTGSSEAPVRAAAYEALGRLLERTPDTLEPHLRKGLADPDARVRRRVVLATATARGLATREMLDPLREDPDPQVRRVIRQVLRQISSSGSEARAPVSNRSLRA